MKYILLILTYLISTTVFGQSDDIYRLTFSDSSNFKLTTYLGLKMPKVFLVIDTTKAWNSKRFWLTDFDTKKKKKVIKDIQKDEHHPYFHTYLFSDSGLDHLIEDDTKKELGVKAKNFEAKRISFDEPNYKTISSSENIEGYYFVTREPLFSDNNEFAFIDLTVYYKDNFNQPINETYFGTICIVFQKQGSISKKIAKKDWLIL